MNETENQPHRVVVGLSGASGAAYGVAVLKALQQRGDVTSILTASRPAEKTLFHETGLRLRDLKELADEWRPVEDIGADIASGSFLTAGMIIAPCSINSMSAIAYGMASNLLVRAADVTLKEKRPLVLMVRESPLHLGHLRAMTLLAEMGAVIAPPVPAFYNRPESIEDLVRHSAERALDSLGLPGPGVKRWRGMKEPSSDG